MSTYASHLKRTKTHPDNRWIVKFDSNGLVKEVKLIYNPKEYRKFKGKHQLINKEKLLAILDEDKANRQTDVKKIL
jgi:hypothetical protein